MMVSPALCKQLELRVGSEVSVRFDIVDPAHVVVPPAQRRRWDALTPGQRRALLASVSAAKTNATRLRRVATLFEPLKRMQRKPR